MQGGQLPLLVEMLACLYSSYSAFADSGSNIGAPGSPVLNSDVIANPPSILNLSTMEVPGHIDQYLVESDKADDWYAEEIIRSDGRCMIGAEFIYYKNLNDVVGDSTEMGLSATMHQEPRNFGDLEAYVGNTTQSHCESRRA